MGKATSPGFDTRRKGNRKLRFRKIPKQPHRDIPDIGKSHSNIRNHKKEANGTGEAMESVGNQRFRIKTIPVFNIYK